MTRVGVRALRSPLLATPLVDVSQKLNDENNICYYVNITS